MPTNLFTKLISITLAIALTLVPPLGHLLIPTSYATETVHKFKFTGDRQSEYVFDGSLVEFSSQDVSPINRFTNPGFETNLDNWSIDPEESTAERDNMGADLSGSAKWIGGVLGSDGKIYAISYSSTDILIIDPSAGTAERDNMGADLSGSAKWIGGVLGSDDKIYAIPSNSTDILIIDPAAGTATRDNMGADLSGSAKWIGGVLGSDGKIYAIPRNSTDILIIDPAAGTAERDNMGADLSGSAKWAGGVLGPDGKIYGIPRNSEDILIITPAALKERDTDTKLSGSASAKVTSTIETKFTQAVNLENPSTYTLTAAVYNATEDEEGGVVDENVAQLYAGDGVINTTYTSLGDGWYRLTGTVTGTNSSKDYGVQVSPQKVVNIDSLTLTKNQDHIIYTKKGYKGSITSWHGLEIEGDADIRYQVCTDEGDFCNTNNTWRYYDGEKWTTAVNTTDHVNTKEELTKDAFKKLRTDTGKLSIRAILLHSKGTNPQLKQINVLGVTDTTKPKIEVEVINNDPTNPNITDTTQEGDKTTYTTTERQITLRIKVTNTEDKTAEITHMRISEHSHFRHTQWQPYKRSKGFRLSAGDGEKTVHIQVRDELRNQSDIYTVHLILEEDTQTPHIGTAPLPPIPPPHTSLIPPAEASEEVERPTTDIDPSGERQPEDTLTPEEIEDIFNGREPRIDQLEEDTGPQLQFPLLAIGGVVLGILILIILIVVMRRM